MSERDATALLDRLAASTPALDVSVPGVVEAGRRRVRRRRAVTAGGMTFAALALGVTLWWGPGGIAGPEGAEQLAPAGLTWEVDAPRTVTAVPDGAGDVSPLSFTRSDDSLTATFEVDGQEETVVGREGVGGVQVFAGERATVLLWTPPPEADLRSWVVPDPELPPDGSVSTIGYSGGRFTDGDQELAYWWTTLPGYQPEDILHHDDDSVWTVSGRVAETVPLRDGDDELTGFALPELDVGGYLERGSLTDDAELMVVDDLAVQGPAGEDGYRSLVARLPEQAVFAREVYRDGPDQEVMGVSEARPTVGLGGSDLVLIVGEWLGGSPNTDSRSYTVQWSPDGLTWYDQDPDDPTASDLEPGPVGPGGRVVLLDEVYDVAVDDQGWPQLLEQDGTTFLKVTDEQGPSDGGVVMWREHWWPWSDRNEVHFAVDGQPVVGPDVDAQDAVTISGPSGVVGLLAVPAGS